MDKARQVLEMAATLTSEKAGAFQSGQLKIYGDNIEGYIKVEFFVTYLRRETIVVGWTMENGKVHIKVSRPDSNLLEWAHDELTRLTLLDKLAEI